MMPVQNTHARRFFMKRAAELLAFTVIASAGLVPASSAADEPVVRVPCHTAELIKCGVGHVQTPKVEVVFVLDTTGSMSGLIEGAKQKIWSIASEIAQAQPAPELKMGLVGYRDRGDDYITTRTEMTDDIDTVYEKLMGFRAGGGGDTPESVNQALFEAVERFDWSDDPSTLKIVFLVGDAPPQMDYQDDVKYQASCKFAAERGIIVNTIQCGNLGGTKEHWTKMANLTNGRYAAIAQDSGVQRIATPFDAEITELDQQLASLMIGYGNSDEMKAQQDKRARSSRISSKSAPEASADRAMYNQSTAGKRNLYGSKELIDDLNSGLIELEEIKSSNLPAELQSKSKDELKAIVAKNAELRSKIESRLGELAKLRKEHQAKAREELPSDGFDMKVLRTLKEQGASIGLKFSAGGDPEPGSKKESKGKKETKDED